MRALFYFYPAYGYSRTLEGIRENLNKKCWKIMNTQSQNCLIFTKNQDFIILCNESQVANFQNIINSIKPNKNNNEKLYIWVFGKHNLPTYNRQLIGIIGYDISTYLKHDTFDEILQEIFTGISNKPLLTTDPLIIIFITETYDEWKIAIVDHKAIHYDDNLTNIDKSQKTNSRIIEFKINSDYTVLFVKENNLEKDKGGIDDLLDKILNKWGNGLAKDDIYVAIHDINNYLKDKSKFENRVGYICDFHHSDSGINKEFCDELISFLEKVNNDKLNEAVETCGKIIELIKQLSMIDVIDLSILKHQIVNLLEPLRIDIEGLIDRDFEDNYWEKVSGAWKNKDKIDEIFIEVREKVYKKDDEVTIEKIVDDRKLCESKSWEEIQNLLPRQNLTGDEKVNELLKALSSSDKNKKNKVRQILELYGNVYKQWMDKLINAIDQLKNELGQ